MSMYDFADRQDMLFPTLVFPTGDALGIAGDIHPRAYERDPTKRKPPNNRNS